MRAKSQLVVIFRVPKPHHSFKDSCTLNNKKGSEKEKVIKCNYCGKEHKPGKTNCLASGKKCNKCKGKNHFSSVCQSKVNVV